MPKSKHSTRTADGGYAKSPDPKRNAGISLTQAEINKLDDYKKEVGLDSRSAVVSLLIEKMPELWADWLRSQP